MTTYFEMRGFSVNEGNGPANIHVSWLRRHHWFFIYIFCWRWRWHWEWKKELDSEK